MTYIPLLIFLLLAIGVVVAEAVWLTRSGWTTSARAWTFVISTDLIGFGLGGFVSFAIFGIMLMMVFGPSGRGGTSSDASYVALTVLAFLFPPIILLFVKRIFLTLFAMRGGKGAWFFSLVAGFGAAAIVAVPPGIVFYMLSRFA